MLEHDNTSGRISEQQANAVFENCHWRFKIKPLAPENDLDMPAVYTVHAYRWGDRESHSYSVGVFTDPEKALAAAEAESEYRGLKYKCEVLRQVLNAGGQDSVYYPKVILALPSVDQRACLLDADKK